MLLQDHRVVRGIEVDRAGSLVAIHVANKCFDEPNLLQPNIEWQRVLWYGSLSGAPNILHVCRDQSPDQFCGVPVIAPVIESLKQLSRYSDAELSASIIRSFFAIFFINQKKDWSLNEVTGEDIEDPAKDFKLGSPSVTNLPPFTDVKSIDSANSQSTFGDYTNAFIKAICAAVGLPAEVVMKNFNASYSASRAALLQAEDEFKQRRAAFVQDFCRPIFEMFLTEAIALGRIEAEGFFDNPLRRQAWLAADWFATTTKAIDPLKEASAQAKRLESGLSTYHKEIAESVGLDFDDVIETLAQERRLLKSLQEE